MTISIEEILQAANGGPLERNAVSDEALTAFIEAESRAISEHVEHIRRALYVSGLAAADVYCTLVKERRLTDQESPYIPRVRWDERYQTPSCAWEKQIRKAIPLQEGAERSDPGKCGSRCSYIASVPRKGTGIRQKMKIIILTKSVRIHKKTKRVPSSAFHDAPPWAQMTAGIVEDRFCRLRKLICSISNVSRSIHHFNTIIKDN